MTRTLIISRHDARSCRRCVDHEVGKREMLGDEGEGDVRFRDAESGPERAFNHDVIIILRGERRFRWRHGHQLAMAILRLIRRLIYTVFMSPIGP